MFFMGNLLFYLMSGYKVKWLPFKAFGQVFSACPFFSAACQGKELVSDGPAGETDAFLPVPVAAGYVFCVCSWQLLSVFRLPWQDGAVCRTAAGC